MQPENDPGDGQSVCQVSDPQNRAVEQWLTELRENGEGNAEGPTEGRREEEEEGRNPEQKVFLILICKTRK
ncbi:hypothetical protein CgunFtcFv8_026289 [Champsocephalus gunnari]|uniref:Uncharacterized protein n=1 Tax=Champsocephalus gunnari TaxID=52237 RepID=A0AAN8CD82_CHAGU|nr:hypothetical protein CgunFtcFv8_026289 [Champsocephalus gunnari]